MDSKSQEALSILTVQIFVNIVFLEVLILCTEKLRSNMEEFLAFHKHHKKIKAKHSL